MGAFIVATAWIYARRRPNMILGRVATTSAMVFVRDTISVGPTVILIRKLLGWVGKWCTHFLGKIVLLLESLLELRLSRILCILLWLRCRFLINSMSTTATAATTSNASSASTVTIASISRRILLLICVGQRLLILRNQWLLVKCLICMVRWRLLGCGNVEGRLWCLVGGRLGRSRCNELL